MAPQCENVISKDPVEYCGDTPAKEYDLEIPYDGGVATGTAYFCDDCEPAEAHKA